MRIWYILTTCSLVLVKSAAINDQSESILSASQSELREKILQQLLDPTMLRTIADIITISIQDKTVSGKYTVVIYLKNGSFSSHFRKNMTFFQDFLKCFMYTMSDYFNSLN